MKVAVTGARGFIGRHLTTFLTERGDDVVSINRDDWDLASGTAPSATLLADCNGVVHLAALVHVRGQSTDEAFTRKMVETNVRGTGLLANAAVRAGVQRFIFMSSASVYGRAVNGQIIDENSPLRPETAYGRSKVAAEEALRAISRESDLASVALRPPLVYGAGAPGNFRTLLRAASRGFPVPSGALTARHSMISVTNLCDLVACAIEASDLARPAYVAAETARSIGDVYRALCAAAGRRPLIVPFPQSALRLALAALNRGALADALLNDFIMDASTAGSELNWSPRDLFAEELERATEITRAAAAS